MNKSILFIAAISSWISAGAVDASEREYAEINVTMPGKLAELLGDRASTIDSLVVTGTIDAIDFDVMWSASYNGKLTVINLEDAVISDGKVPDYAFYHDEQWTGDRIKVIRLQRIMLGEGVTEIGKGAFMYATNLREITLPESLRKLGDICFSDCSSLMTSPLVIPEGVTDIPRSCFIECRSLTEVVLPSTIKNIGTLAFFSTHITNINFPEGLESIGECAFYGASLEEVTLPASCVTLNGSGQFALNRKLRSISLPEGITVIPDDFAEECMNLTNINIPSTVTTIGRRAFYLSPLSNVLRLPEGLTTIGDMAFYKASGLNEVTFPSTLALLGVSSCAEWTGVKALRCCGAVPPESIMDVDGFGPFGKPDFSVNSGIFPNIPVYVPTGSASLYRQAPGWEYFFNIIEVDDPSAGLVDIMDGEKVEISADGNEIVISFVDSNNTYGYTIYSLDGKMIAVGNGSARVAVTPGYYIVNTPTGTRKVRI